MAISQWKTFIIAWSIGLIISLYFLITTIISVAKPSNPINEEPSQTINQEIEQQTWQNTIAPNTGEQNTPSQKDGEISIIIPLQLRNTWFDLLANTISGTTIKYQIITWIQHYNTLLTGWRDLAIIPSDIMISLQPHTQSLKTTEDIWPYFHSSTESTQKWNTFIPFAIDPRVTYINPNSKVPSGGISRNNLLSFVVLRKQSRAYSIALGRGINDTDIRNTLQNNHLYPEYPYLTQSIIQTLIKDNDITSRNSFLDFINNTPNRQWQRTTQLANILHTRNSICKNFTQVCLWYYNFTDIWFDTRSSLSIRKNFFEEQRESPTIEYIPYESSYPVRIRWFMIASGANLEQTAQYLQAYMQNSITNDITLHTDTIPAHNQTRQWMFLQTERKKFQTIQQRFTPIVGEINSLERVFRTTQFINVLQGNITPANFLQQNTNE